MPLLRFVSSELIYAPEDECVINPLEGKSVSRSGSPAESYLSLVSGQQGDRQHFVRDCRST